MLYLNQNRIVLQFHVTGRCNLNCKHCYRVEGNVEPLSYGDVISVVDQFIVLKNKYNQEHNIKKRGHINLTGGEPFFREDIKDIINYLGKQRTQITYSVLSNGSFIDEEIIELLLKTEVSFVQLSIDGDEKTHDELRAPGDYVRVFKKAEILERAGIRTHISFTANKANFKYLPTVAYECRRRHVSKLWSDRLVPIGTGETLEQLKITENDMQKYISALKKAQGSVFTRFLYPKTQVTMNRALQFINSDGGIYSCSAGDSLITVDEFGRVMPCRRMPIICGDVFSSTLSDIYYTDSVFTNLRKKDIPKECVACEYSTLCNGGAKCQSFAVYGSYDRKDPACFICSD